MKRITQEDLASFLGVTRQTIHAIENDKYNPSLELAFKIAKYFETTIEAVFLYKKSVEE
jgi:putative transcriptional regulator